MVFKKIKTKSGSNSLTGVVIVLLISMAFFIGGYLYLVYNVESAGSTLDGKYAASYGNMTASQDALEGDINEVRDSFNDIKEADSTFQVAWNGLKGLGNALKLPIVFIDTTLSVWTAAILPVEFIPGWVIALIFIGILAFVVLLILKILKGEPNM